MFSIFTISFKLLILTPPIRNDLVRVQGSSPERKTDVVIVRANY